MLRLILIVLILGIRLTCFSKEVPQIANKLNLDDESLTLVYIGCGNENLMSHNYSLSLENFQKASSLLEKLEYRFTELDFLIYFGKIIAYDNLGLQDQCQNTIDSLCLLLDIDKGTDNSEFDTETTYLSQEYEKACDILKKLIVLAPSPNIREFLLSLVNELSEQLLPMFKIVHSNTIGLIDWKYYNNENTVSYELCKSHFWKKLENIAKKIYNAIIKAKQVWDIIKEIDEKIKE